jgi:membrane protease YdiL (CAAX protease family)
VTTDQKPPDRRPIASYWHTLGFVLFSIVPVIYGTAMQKGAPGTPAIEPATPERLKFYLVSIGGDWFLFSFCWAGVHWRGGDFFDLAGGRWKSGQEFLKDVAIALPFWVVWELAARAVHWMLGPDHAKSVQPLLPQSFLEVAVWLAVCVTAGYCEEMIFRGYLQRQFLAMSGSVTVAVVGQALFFGIGHVYQGWKQVAIIVVLGVLYGALAAWRKDLRANIIAHTWSDVWEGWLKFLLFR